MCAFLILIFTGPRVLIALWWLFQPSRWDAAFSSVIFPILGFVLLPWTTLMWVAVAPFGNVAGTDWLWLAIAFMGDLFSGAGGILRRPVPVRY